MLRSMFLVVALVSLTSLFADERPKIPAHGEDTKLFKGQSAAAFFAARAAQSQCRSQLQSARTEYHDLRTELQRMVKAGASGSDLEDQEQKMNTARSILLGHMEECGECASQELERRTVPGGLQTEQ